MKQLEEAYAILGVESDCPDGDLKTAYKSLALKHYAVKNPTREATETFQVFPSRLSLGNVISIPQDSSIQGLSGCHVRKRCPLV